jgi:hypothetical protein
MGTCPVVAGQPSDCAVRQVKRSFARLASKAVMQKAPDFNLPKNANGKAHGHGDTMAV